MSRQLGSLFPVVVLAAAVLGGCGGGDGDDETTAERRSLKLFVQSPKAGDVTRRDRIVVRGTVTPGSDVTVDDRPAGIVGPAPGNLERFEAKASLDPGENDIEVEATQAGFEPARQRLTVRRRTRLRFEVERPASGATTTRARIKVVVTAPEEADVFIAGRRAERGIDGEEGSTPPFEVRVPLVLGRNRIRIRVSRSGYDTAVGSITITRRPAVVEVPEPPTEEPPPPDCHPEYKGACVPVDGDVDCPEIPADDFRSVGDDPYGLDRDGDGIACES